MEEKIRFTADSHFGKVLYEWWQSLEADRATRAVLKRCSTLDAVALTAAYQHFYRYMLMRGWPTDAKDWQKDRLAAIAGLLAHVKSEDTQSLPLAMSEKNGDKNLVSELRFKSLLKADTIDDVFIDLRRVLPLIGKKADIYQLAKDVYYWNDNTKKQWAYSYRWA